ncbi:helix-turn-helix domain-containing protein [Saccharopolyspora elongata]|uniref:Helix-turn-helix domain-containing protein n=2 Tax=Saccharopolyspora elongata TaxID=2530387 RepID=A0A4V2YJA2_9PSEU|nr:helix-turn-helix domain-containing protein [Saccharopolyspora elongata]
MTDMGGRAPSATFGSELRRRRKEKDLSLRRLADQVYYSFGYLSKLERGEATPGLQVAADLDEALGAENQLLELAADDALGGLRLSKPAQLPSGVADHVGQHRELACLEAVRAQTTPGSARSVVVTGGAGVGKTSLALRWAGQVAEHFPDGQLFADFGGWGPRERRAPEEVLEEFLSALGVPSVMLSLTPREQMAALFRTLLAERRLLLVLDDVDSSEQVLPLLPNAPGCMVVVTSRHRLDGVTRTGAMQVTAEGFAPADSRDLLARVVGQARIDAEPAAAESIAARCSHLPLAVRIAADQCAAHPHRSLTELAEELAEDPLDWVSPPGSAAGVRDAISASVERLPSEAAQLFRFAGLAQGELDMQAAAAISGWPVDRARRWMQHLCDEHLIVETARDRYRMADLVRATAAERLQSTEQPETIALAVRRWVQWWAHSASAASAQLAPHLDLPALEAPDLAVASLIATPTNPIAARRWWELNVPQLASVIEQAAEIGQPRAAWSVAVLSGHYLASTTRYRDWVAAMSTAASIADAAHDVPGKAWCAYELGIALAVLRRHDEALAHLSEAVRLRDSLDDRVGLAWAHCAMAATVLDMGRYEDARRTAAVAADEFRRHGNDFGVATAMVWLGTALQRLGILDQSLTELTGALARFDKLGAADGVALALVRLSDTYRLQGDHDRALDHVDRGIARRRQLQDDGGVADGLLVRGQIHHDQGDVAAARRAWTAALEIFDDRGDPRASDARARLATIPPPSRGET